MNVSANRHSRNQEDAILLGEGQAVSSLQRCHYLRALKIALFVGVVLISINQGDQIINGTLTLSIAIKMLLTPFVPFAVSLYSSWTALR